MSELERRIRSVMSDPRFHGTRKDAEEIVREVYGQPEKTPNVFGVSIKDTYRINRRK